MEHLIFYCGACLMGILSLISMLAVYSSNKKILKDLRHPTEPKDKWMGNFVQEHQKLLKENTKIQNPSVYVTKRMRGRKIGPWSIRQMKCISWAAFILSFLFMGMQLLLLKQTGMETAAVSLGGRAVSAMKLTGITAAVMGIVLLSLRLLIGTGYQEDEMETNLLDYIENRWKEPVKVVPLETAKTTVKKVSKAPSESSKKKAAENFGRKAPKVSASKERERAVQQMEQGILETAAADSRYKHLLNKEEEAIVKDVIKEFLT